MLRAVLMSGHSHRETPWAPLEPPRTHPLGSPNGDTESQESQKYNVNTEQTKQSKTWNKEHPRQTNSTWKTTFPSLMNQGIRP